MENSTQITTDTNHMSFVTSAMERWSKSLTQLTLPSDLVSRSSIDDVVDLNGQVVICEMLLGERTGEKDDIPYDGGGVKNHITDFSKESLWLYGQAEIPPGFDTSKGLFSSKWKPFYIGTGKTQKCPSCRGRGVIKCSKCKGRGSYESGFIGSDKKTWEPCSCGNGYNECSRCSGYGSIQDAIKCNTRYRTATETGVVYFGPDFDDKSSQQTVIMIQNSTGKLLLEEVIEFPLDELEGVLMGGVDTTDYSRLKGLIKEKIKNIVNQQLDNSEYSIQVVCDALLQLFDDMPNPVQANKVLEYEILPVRIRIRVQKRPVFKVSYTYQEKTYTLWVYGNEGKVYASERPKEFTKEAKIAVAIAAIILVVGIIAAIISMVNSM